METVDVTRLDAEVEDLVVRADILRTELEHEVELLKKTIEVNRQDTLGLVMRASGIHTKALNLLIVVHRARIINDLRYPAVGTVAETMMLLDGAKQAER